MVTFNEEDAAKIRNQLTQARQCIKLCRDLIDPDKYAPHVPEAVRQRVYEIFDKDGET